MEEKTISLADLSNYRLVSKADWEKIEKLARELSQERSMWKEKFEELNKRHLALCDDHHHLSCAYCGFLRVVCDHNIDPKEILAAIEEHESPRPSVADIAMEVEKNDKYEKLKREYDELEFKYDLQKSENVRLTYINARIGIIAKAKCPEIAAFLERMKLMREQGIKDVTERAKENAEESATFDPDEEREFYEDDYPGWGTTFEQAAQKSSREEETKSENATIEDDTLDVLRTKLHGRHASVTPLGLDGATSEEVVFESISSTGDYYVIVWRCRGEKGFYKLRFHPLAILQLGNDSGLLIGRSDSYPETKYEVVVKKSDDKEE